MANKIDNPLIPVGRPAARAAEPVRAGSAEAQALARTQAIAAAHMNAESAVVQVSAADTAAAPQVDMARVQAVRASLDSGTYRVDPDEIAARLTALERELSR